MMPVILPRTLKLIIVGLFILTAAAGSLKGINRLFLCLSKQNDMVISTYDPDAMLYIIKYGEENVLAIDHFNNKQKLSLDEQYFLSDKDHVVSAEKGWAFLFVHESPDTIMPTKVIFLDRKIENKMCIVELLKFAKNHRIEENNDAKSFNTLLFLCVNGILDRFEILMLRNAIIGYVKSQIHFVVNYLNPLSAFNLQSLSMDVYPIKLTINETIIMAQSSKHLCVLKLNHKDLNINQFLWYNFRSVDEQAESIYTNIIKYGVDYELPAVNEDLLANCQNVKYESELISEDYEKNKKYLIKVTLN